jgi:uncharacterized protein
MTKAPRAGTVKTRLVPPLTAEEAAELNICFLRDISQGIQRSKETTGKGAGVAVYTPVGAEDAYEKILPPEFFLMPQRGQQFGDRLCSAAEDLFSVGFESVCLINSDSPTVPADYFSQATRVLAESDGRIVLGPSDDGGYYLIGLKRLHPRLFEDIDWSTEKVLQQTIDRAAEIKMGVHFLPSWFDVDDRATLQRLCTDLFERDIKHSAVATKTFLNNLFAGSGRERIFA